MPTPDDLRARPGELIEQRLERFERYARGTDIIIAGPEHRIDRTYDRTLVTLVDRTPWNSPFKVAASADRARVAPGTVETATGEPTVPTIKGIDLYGFDKDGLDTGEIPEIEIEEGPLGGRSSVCLKLTGMEDDPEQPSEDEEDPITVVHILDLVGARKAAPQFVGFKVLAHLYWSEEGDAITRIGQVTHHNLHAEWIPGTGEKTGRYLFGGT